MDLLLLLIKQISKLMFYISQFLLKIQYQPPMYTKALGILNKF